MTLVEFYSASQKTLRETLEEERRRLDGRIREAAVERRMDEVDELRPQLDDVNDDLALLDTIVLRDIVAARLTLPSLPPNFREILANGEADLRRWQQLQGVIQNTIAVAGAVAEGVSTMAALVMKYGKFLV